MKLITHTRNIICLATLLLAQHTSAQIFRQDSMATRFGAAVSGEVLNKAVRTNVANTLFGQIKGLYVMQAAAEPNVLDDQATFNIRGISTSGNAAPMVLIDGIERNIEQLTTAEIDRVEVLDNAVASALYGVRGANGAVLIVTKRGHSGFCSSIDYQCSFDTPFRLPEFENAANYASLMNEALSLDGLPARYSDREIAFYADGSNPELFPNVDWQDMAYRKYGMTHQANAQFEGGNDKFKYYTSLNYGNTSGLLGHTDMFSQYKSQLYKIFLNLRANIDVQLAKRTLLRLNLMGRLKEQQRPGTDMTQLFTHIYDTPQAAFPVMTGTGHWGGSDIYDFNPVAEIADRGNVKAVRRTLLADMTLHQGLDFLTEGLYTDISVAYDNMANYNDARTRKYEYEMVSPVWNENGELAGCRRKILGKKDELGWSSSLNMQEMYVEFGATIGYRRSFGRHDLHTEVTYQQDALRKNGRNTSRKHQSLLGKAAYCYNNRYSADLVVNYSGTAVLPQHSRFNIYPAIALGWVASNEEFLRHNKVVSYLKFSTSVGLSGSDLFSHDLDRQSFGIVGGEYWFGANNTPIQGIKEGDLAVTRLRAEQSLKFDAEVRLGLWNKLFLSAGYFNETRSDILVSGTPVISGVIGIGASQLCKGKVRNQGVELALSYGDTIGKFAYSVSANMTYAHNRILNKNEGFKPEPYLYQTGNSLNGYYGLQTNGFYNSWDEIRESDIRQNFGELRPGDIRYTDQNGDKVVNENDVVRLGYSQLPEIYYGFNVDLSYGGFSICAHFQGVAHRDICLNTPSVFRPLGNDTNISTWYTRKNCRWTPQTAESANLPRLSSRDNPNNSQKSDLWMTNGNYLKLRDLELAYTLGRRILRKFDMTFYLRGTNLFSIDHLKYMDPENYNAAYPTMRSYTLGIGLKF